MQNKVFFETERLRIYEPSKNDYDNLCILQTNAEVMRYFGGVRSKQQIKQRMEDFLLHYEKFKLGYGLVFDKECGNFIGRCGLNRLGFNDSDNRVEMGIILMPQYWNHGYGYEICNGLLNYGFNFLGLNEIHFIVNIKNGASIRIAKKVHAEYLGQILYFDQINEHYLKRL